MTTTTAKLLAFATGTVSAGATGPRLHHQQLIIIFFFRYGDCYRDNHWTLDNYARFTSKH